jgi:hypothetical protein
VADWAFRVLSLLLLVGLAWYALRAYHQRELARIETAELDLEGYVKLALAAITFFWQCPDCGMPLMTREGLEAHNSARSSCAWHVGELDAEEELAEAEAEHAKFRAEQVAAGLRPDTWPALGAEEAPAELGAGQ